VCSPRVVAHTAAADICPITKKKFRSRSTYENYLCSKKYLQLVAKAEQAASETDRRSTASQQVRKEKELKATAAVSANAAAIGGGESQQLNTAAASGGVTTEERDAEGTTPPNHRRTRCDSTGFVPADDVGDSDEGDDEGGWVDEEEPPWVAVWTESLFDTHCTGPMPLSDAFENTPERGG